MERKVIEGLTPNTPQWEKAMRRCVDASEKCVPVSKRKKKIERGKK